MAALLKLYPLASLLAEVLVRPLRQRRVPIAFMILAIALLGMQWRDILLIKHSTPIYTYASFGVLSIKEQAISYAARYGLSSITLRNVGYGAMLTCYLLGKRGERILKASRPTGFAVFRE